MKPERLKLYLEILKTLTAIIIGTGAGVYGLITLDDKNKANYDIFLIFIICFCSAAVIAYVMFAIFVDTKLKRND